MDFSAWPIGFTTAFRLCGRPRSCRLLRPFTAQALGTVTGFRLLNFGRLAGLILALSCLVRFGLGVGSSSFSTRAVITVVIRAARAPHWRAGNALFASAFFLIGPGAGRPLLLLDHRASEHVLAVAGGLVGPTCSIGTLSNPLATLPRCFFVASAFGLVGHTRSRATIRIPMFGSPTGTSLRLTGHLADLSRFGAQGPGGLPGTLACGLTCLSGGPSGTFTDLACSLACSPAHVFGGLPGPLADLADRLASAFAYVADSLASALADLAHRVTGAFTDLTDRVTGAFADLAHRVARARAHVADRFARA
ncbi:hypothetical protein GT755_08625 [Herbidospora sp. NEAU-GS84]|uniref:Uncharacterized protein n=1 Tax=Herbidospora solisilvae TaxID=2696284 RepID=A0A7C9N008_9ACTN|nr:hypothetical protein [Herbidospora solisilvae]NAS21749.1 hypothetical protein [Herbidospora solisilvae]